MVERQETAVGLLVLHQQFAKLIEPTVRHFNSPTPCLFLGRAFALNGLLPPAFDMRDVAVPLNDLQSGRSGIASIGAQVLVPPDGWAGSLDHDGIKHRRQLRNII